MNIKFLLITLIVITNYGVDAQIDCTQAPTASLRMVCEMTYRWDQRARVCFYNELLFGIF